MNENVTVRYETKIQVSRVNGENIVNCLSQLQILQTNRNYKINGRKAIILFRLLNFI